MFFYKLPFVNNLLTTYAYKVFLNVVNKTCGFNKLKNVETHTSVGPSYEHRLTNIDSQSTI